MRQLILLISIRWLAGCAAELRTSKVSGVVCSFKEKIYRPGDRWHPYLEPFGFMLCVRCACTETGLVKCSTIKCPSLGCANPVTDSQQCCPRCADEPRFPAGLRAPVKSCRYNGTIYQPGETFTKHHLFPTRLDDQCVLCTCSNGNVFCALKTCRPPTCPSPEPRPDSCCLACPDGSKVEEGGQQLHREARHSVDQCAGEAPGRAGPPRRTVPRALSLAKLHLRDSAETTVKILLQKKHQRACLYNGHTYSHGDVWHPVLGKVLECIRCACRDGTQDCKRITCPSEYPCQHPMKTDGKCCKICPELRSENRTQCYLGHGNNNLLVYKVEPSTKGHSQDTVRIIALERQGAAEVEVQVWKMVGGLLQMIETAEVPRKDLLDHPENYTLLTTLNKETWRTFQEEGEKQGAVPQSITCEEGIREVVKFLNPQQLESTCSV